jgi:hypothetical protein
MNPDIRTYIPYHYGTGYMSYPHYSHILPQWGNWNNDWNNHNNNNWNSPGYHYGNNDWNNHHIEYGYSIPLSLYHHYHPYHHPLPIAHHLGGSGGATFAVPLQAAVR